MNRTRLKKLREEIKSEWDQQERIDGAENGDHLRYRDYGEGTESDLGQNSSE